MSLPTRERELKRPGGLSPDGADKSLPTRERELKHGVAPLWRHLRASLPSRERELKLYQHTHTTKVAPLAGARIETLPTHTLQKSLPTRERELKLVKLCLVHDSQPVAPHAGARIETRAAMLLMLLVLVAPHAGARQVASWPSRLWTCRWPDFGFPFCALPVVVNLSHHGLPVWTIHKTIAIH